MYKSNPEIKWAGAAAFASKQAGCGMQSAKDVPMGLGSPTLDALSAGNNAVFKELYPAIRFYDKFGPQKLKECESAVDPPLAAGIRDGFDMIAEGRADEGAIEMLKNEQLNTLQKAAYESKLFKAQLWLNQKLQIEPIELHYSAECKTVDVSKVVAFEKKGQLYDPAIRWPYAQDAANKFITLSEDPKTKADIDASLDAIIANSTQ